MPFILSGGSGTRLWPLSRTAYPKQFLDLAGDTSLFQQSCERVSDPMFGAINVLCNNEHRFLIAEELAEMGAEDSSIILEPVARNTAPAALVAALSAHDDNEGALVLLMPSDHVIRDVQGFRTSVARGLEPAQSGSIVTFGIKPDRPETGFGYIETDEQQSDILTVRQFVEKPDRQTAAHYVESGRHFWNAGIFLFSAKAMIEAFAEHHPSCLKHCRAAFENSVRDLDFIRLDEAAYQENENISLDYAVIEKHDNIKCIPLDSDWNDLGSWSALWEIGGKDENGNVVHGDVALQDVHGCIIHNSGSGLVSVIGMEDVIAVATRDVVMIAPKDRAQDVKEIVAQLEEAGRTEVDLHTRVYRPWGFYEGVDRGARFQVKRLSVKPGAQLSLQSHRHRAEHWVVVSGTAEVTIGNEVKTLGENQSTYIPIGMKHRLGNPGKSPAILVEVQSGSYLGEDDIIRYEDDFNRLEE